MIYADDDLVVTARRAKCCACPYGVVFLDGVRCRKWRDDVGRIDATEYRRRLLEKDPAGCPEGKWLHLEGGGI